MHCNLKKVLKAVVNMGAKTLIDIKRLAPEVRNPRTKVASLVQSGYLVFTETGEIEATEKGIGSTN